MRAISLQALEYMQEEVSQAAAQLHAAQGELHAERSNVAELRQLCGALRQQVALLRNGQSEVLHQVELERTAARTAQEKVGGDSNRVGSWGGCGQMLSECNAGVELCGHWRLLLLLQGLEDL